VLITVVIPDALLIFRVVKYDQQIIEGLVNLLQQETGM